MPVVHRAWFSGLQGYQAPQQLPWPLPLLFSKGLTKNLPDIQVLGQLYLVTVLAKHMGRSACYRFPFIRKLQLPCPRNCIKPCSYSQPSPAQHSSRWRILLSVRFSSDVFCQLGCCCPSHLQCCGTSPTPHQACLSAAVCAHPRECNPRARPFKVYT